LLKEVSNSSPSYAIKLLSTADRLAGRRMRLYAETIKKEFDFDLLTEKVFLSLLEYIGDPSVTSN